MGGRAKAISGPLPLDQQASKEGREAATAAAAPGDKEKRGSPGPARDTGNGVSQTGLCFGSLSLFVLILYVFLFVIGT